MATPPVCPAHERPTVGQFPANPAGARSWFARLLTHSFPLATPYGPRADSLCSAVGRRRHVFTENAPAMKMLSFTRTSSAIKQYLKIVEAATVVCILGDTQQDTVAGPSKRAPDSASALQTSEGAPGFAQRLTFLCDSCCNRSAKTPFQRRAANGIQYYGRLTDSTDKHSVLARFVSWTFIPVHVVLA